MKHLWDVVKEILHVKTEKPLEKEAVPEFTRSYVEEMRKRYENMDDEEFQTWLNQ